MKQKDITSGALRWHCRRGMLELDVVLARFLSHRYSTLTLAEQQAFGELLEWPDPVLWDLIIGQTQSDNTRLVRIIEWLRVA